MEIISKGKDLVQKKQCSEGIKYLTAQYSNHSKTFESCLWQIARRIELPALFNYDSREMVDLLLTEYTTQAILLNETLNELNIKKGVLTQKILKTAYTLAAEQNDDNVIVIELPLLEIMIGGFVAQKVRKHFHKQLCIVFCRFKDMYIGYARAAKGLSLIKIFKTIKKIEPELQFIKTKGAFSTWRVYFDIVEHEEERRTETYIVKEKQIVQHEETDENGEVHVYDVEEIIEKEVTEELSLFEAKFIEVSRPKDEQVTALDLIKRKVIEAITAYDTSSNVNAFVLNDNIVWLDKDTRVGLMNSTNIQKAAGLEETVLWLGTTPIRINCDLAIQLLGALEIYALDSFNKTAEHKKNVEALTTVDEVAAYDYTAGYPEKLEINI